MQTLQNRHEAAASMLPAAKCVIAGRDFLRSSGGSHLHINPSTGRPQAEVPVAGVREVDMAVAAASKAFELWRKTAGSHRRNLILKLCELLQGEVDELGTIAALENGTTKSAFVQGQMPMIVEWLTYYAGWADKIDGVFSGGSISNFELVIPEPYGVVAMIIPWNGPLGALAMKAAAALVAGNTLVIKPPESTPFLAVKFVDLAREAGFPDGVLNLVIGGVEAGMALVSHQDVDKITFTGSPSTARSIVRASAEHLTPAIYELGGKSANIVFPDAPNLADAAAYAAGYAFLNAGQFCVCPSRLIVHRDIYDEFIARAVSVASNLSVGDPLLDETNMGPLFNVASLDRVLEAVKQGSTGGRGRLAFGGQRLGGELENGFFVSPAIVTDVDPKCALSQSEIFGPVLAVHPFDGEDQAVSLANGTEYGLAAYLHTSNMDRALRMARALKAGGIYVNRSYPVANPNLPFGGIGISGYGREGGRTGLDEFLRSKAVSINVGAYCPSLEQAKFGL